MDKDELRERSLELKEEGLSIRGIAKRLSDETGESISKSSVDRALKRPVEPVSEMAETEGEPGVRPVEADMGEPFHVMPTRDRIKPSREVTDALNTVRLQRLELERRQYERKLRLLDQEDELAHQEKEAALNERRLRLQQGGINPSQNPEQAQALQIELANIQQTRAELQEEKAKLTEQRHKVELDALSDKIADLGDKLDGRNRTGKGEFDVISEGLQAVNSQLSSMQSNLFAWLNKNTTLQQFNPARKTEEERRKAGEELLKKVEKVRANLPCYVPGVGGFCASESVGRLPQCATCHYKPKETVMPYGEGEVTS